jgi:hypothetical protein
MRLLKPSVPGASGPDTKGFAIRNSKGIGMFRRAIVATVAGFGCWLCAPALARAVVWGGAGGVVNGHRVGPLWMNRSSPTAVARWAGRPSSVEYVDSQSEPTSPKRASFAQTYYNGAASDNAKGTVYTFWRSSSGWRLTEFYTTLQRFRTPGGTRVGMGYTQAAERERVHATGGCVAAGFWHSTPPHQPYFGYLASLSGANFTSGHVEALFAFGPHQLLC